MFFTFYDINIPDDAVEIWLLSNNTWSLRGTITSPGIGTIATFSWGASNRMGTLDGELVALDYFDDTNHFFVSLDSAATWTRKAIPDYPHSFNLAIDGIYWLSCDNGAGSTLYYSNDKGNTWHSDRSPVAVGRIILSGHETNASILAVVVDAAFEQTVYVSINAGVTWSAGHALGTLYGAFLIWRGDRLVAFYVVDTGTVFSGTSAITMVYSDNFGASWSAPETLFTNNTSGTGSPAPPPVVGMAFQWLRITQSPTTMFIVPNVFPSPTAGRENIIIRGVPGGTWQTFAAPDLYTNNETDGIAWTPIDDAVYLTGAVDYASSTNIAKLPNATTNTVWEAAPISGADVSGQTGITRPR